MLRFGLSEANLDRLVALGIGEMWEEVGTGDRETILKVRPAFIQRRRNQGGPSRPWQDVRRLLAGNPRYASPALSWEGVERALRQQPPDAEHAARDAIGALEGLGRIVAGLPMATFGDALKAIQKSGPLEPVLAKALEALWGFANSHPGLRHGSKTPTGLSPAKLYWTVDSCAGAIRLLLELDEARPSWAR